MPDLLAAVPAVAVTLVTAAAPAAAAAPATPGLVAPSAAASAEAARVKDLEAKLAQSEAQSSLLQAQNTRLASELEKAQNLSQESTRMASLVQPPSHWQAHSQGRSLLYIELPIPDPASRAGKKLTDTELKAQHKGWFNDMRTNKVNMNDALAALRSGTAPLQCQARLVYVLSIAMPHSGCFYAWAFPMGSFSDCSASIVVGMSAL